MLKQPGEPSTEPSGARRIGLYTFEKNSLRPRAPVAIGGEKALPRERASLFAALVSISSNLHRWYVRNIRKKILSQRPAWTIIPLGSFLSTSPIGTIVDPT